MSLLKNKLTRSRDTLTEERAERIVNSVEIGLNEKVLELEKEINKKEDRLEALLDMSSDARTTTRNAIDELDSDEWVEERLRLKKEIRMKKIYLDIAKQEQKELLGEDTNED